MPQSFITAPAHWLDNIVAGECDYLLIRSRWVCVPNPAILPLVGRSFDGLRRVEQKTYGRFDNPLADREMSAFATYRESIGVEGVR